MTSVVANQFLPLIATAAATTDSMVVSLHDIAPQSQDVTEKIVSELAQRGVRACSLLVVPDYCHQGLATKDRQFVSWLRDLESAGYEIVIHGYFHERPRHANETIRDKFFTRLYTVDEGEFYDLDYDEAFRRITTARDEFRASGLKPRGFVAPAWLLSTEAERAARDAELEYTTRLVRSNWRRAISRAWNATLFRLLKSSPLLRISIHPSDYSHPAIWRQIVDLIDAAIGSRTATTYQDWIAEQRLRRGV
ncbi:MAG: hypothetical protein DME75_04905 [Verrucomicrobia bacterium]|nr:MAG: hypothetical protein DME75_04905 [Verrucomicrobiota bacterium]